MSYSDMDYGDRLRSIRKRLGYTTTEVANAIHISQSYLSAFENKRRTPDLDMLEKVLGFYDVPFEEFFADAGMPGDIQDLVENVKSLSDGQRVALNNFLIMMTKQKEVSHSVSNDDLPTVERIAAHFEGEYGVHDPDLTEHVYNVIRRAQKKSDEEEKSRNIKG